MAVIELRDIRKSYHTGDVEVPVLKGISMTVNIGEYVALMGTSGSGKSTLMNILGCLDKPTAGSYFLNGQEVSELNANERASIRNQEIGFIFQSFNLLSRTSALDNVMMPLVYSSQPLADAAAENRARQLLKRVGLAERSGHTPSQLSGGQQQRVAIARALICSPRILLADEPTGNLDSRTSSEILDMFSELNKAEGLTIVLVTHEYDVAQRAKRIIKVHDGLVVSDTSTQGAGG